MPTQSQIISRLSEVISSLSWTNILLASPVIIFALYHIGLWLVTPKPLPGIPHYPIQPFGDIGRVMAHTKKTGMRSTWFNEVAQDLGPIAQINLAGSKMIVLSDIQEMEDILLRRAKEFDRSDDMVDRFVGFLPHGQISLKTDAEFKAHRRFLTPAMTQKYLSAMTPGMCRNARDLYRFWNDKRAYLDHEAFDPTSDFELSITDTLSELTFGESFELIPAQTAYAKKEAARLRSLGVKATSDSLIGPSSEIHEANNLLLKYAGKTINSLLPRWSHRLNARRSDYRHAKKVVWDFLAEKIKAARASAQDVNDANCVVDLVAGLERTPSLSGSVMPIEELSDELFTYMIGGSETTAVSLRWAVKFLAKYPEVQRKLKAELTRMNIPSALNEDAPLTTFAELTDSQVPYLEAVCNEILRVAKVANITTRQALCDTDILGHAIPKGTTVFFTITGTSFSETEKDRERLSALDPVRSKSSVRKFGYWGNDNEEFIPERWITEEGKFNLRAGPHLPFSVGPRGCYGQKLAMLDLKIYLAFLSSTFFLEALPEHLDDWGVREGLTLAPQTSHVVLKRWEEVN